MNLKTISLSALSVIVAATATAAEPERFTITGHVTNVPDSTVIKLYRDEGQLLKTVALDTIIDGRIFFSDTISGPKQKYRITGESRGLPNYLAPVWVEPGAEITITGDGTLFPLWHISSPIPNQASWEALVKATLPEFAELLQYYAEESEAIKHLYIDLKGEEKYMREGWDKINSIRDAYAPLEKAIEIKKLTYLGSAPIDEVWMDEFSNFAENVYRHPDSELRETVMAIFGRLTPEQLETDLGQIINDYLTMESILNEGDKMADGTLYDLQGNPHTLGELAGKYILLDFWSSGCGPCVASLPEADEVAEKYADRLAFVSISSDGEAEWKEFLAGKESKVIQWNQLLNGQPGLAARYGGFAIPHYVLISPDGIIAAKWSGYGEGMLRQKLSELMTDKK